MKINNLEKSSMDLVSRSLSECNHCWAPGDAVQVVIDTPFGPVQGPFQYKRRCILCGKEIG